MDDRILIETPYGIAELTVSGDELYATTLNDGITRQLRRPDENDNSSGSFFYFALFLIVVLLCILLGIIMKK